jgi:hypothetical protein
MNKRVLILASVLLGLSWVSSEAIADSGSYTVTIKVVRQAYNMNLGKTLGFYLDRSCYSENDVITVSIPDGICISCYQQASETLNFTNQCGQLNSIKFLTAQFPVAAQDHKINQTYELDFDYSIMQYVLKKI